MKEGGTIMASMMAGILKKKKLDDTKKPTQRKSNRFSAMRQKVAEKTSFSLRRNRLQGKRYVKHSPFSRRNKQQFHGNDEDEEVVVFVSPSTTMETADDDDEDTLSPTMEESNLNILEHYSGVIPNTPVLDSPLSDVKGQELFKSPVVEKQKTKSKKSVRFHFEEEEDKSDSSRYVPLSPLAGVSPRTLETILESTLDDDERSTSTSSSETDFHVSFSPANDLFLRTLAVERATALTMSELAFKASVRQSIDNRNAKRATMSVKLRAKIRSTIRYISRRLSLNDVLGIAIIVMTLMNWSGASDYLIGNLQACLRESWNAGLALLGYSATDSRTSALYDHHQDPVGVWLSR